MKTIPNLVGWGIGKKKIKGLDKKKFVIRIYTSKKISSDKLKRQSFPQEIEGIPTEIIEIGKIRLLEPNK